MATKQLVCKITQRKTHVVSIHFGQKARNDTTIRNISKEFFSRPGSTGGVTDPVTMVSV